MAVASSVAGVPALERAAARGRARPRSSPAPTTPIAVPVTRRWPTGCRARARAWSCWPATWSCSPSPFSQRFPGAVINVHPSLLPAFPGLHAIEQALAYGVKVFGVTVHFVDAGVDTGPVILQRAVELPGARTPEQVLAALRPLEHALLPEAVRLFARGRCGTDPEYPRRIVGLARALDRLWAWLPTATRSPAGAGLSRRARRGARPPRAAVGVRQDTVSSTSRADWPSSGSRSSPPAAPLARSPTRASPCARSRSSRASPR